MKEQLEMLRRKNRELTIPRFSFFESFELIDESVESWERREEEGRWKKMKEKKMMWCILCFFYYLSCNRLTSILGKQYRSSLMWLSLFWYFVLGWTLSNSNTQFQIHFRLFCVLVLISFFTPFCNSNAILFHFHLFTLFFPKHFVFRFLLL